MCFCIGVRKYSRVSEQMFTSVCAKVLRSICVFVCVGGAEKIHPF